MSGCCCLSLCARVRKMEFTCVCDDSSLADTSKSGKKLASAKRWARWRDTSWFSKSFFVPTNMRGISCVTKWVSASESQDGSERKLDSLPISYYQLKKQINRKWWQIIAGSFLRASTTVDFQGHIGHKYHDTIILALDCIYKSVQPQLCIQIQPQLCALPCNFLFFNLI